MEDEAMVVFIANSPLSSTVGLVENAVIRLEKKPLTAENSVVEALRLTVRLEVEAVTKEE